MTEYTCPFCDDSFNFLFLDEDGEPCACDNCVKLITFDKFTENDDDVCPVCEEAFDMIYLDKDGVPFACDNCVKVKSYEDYADEVDEAFKDAEFDRRFEEYRDMMMEV